MGWSFVGARTWRNTVRFLTNTCFWEFVGSWVRKMDGSTLTVWSAGLIREIMSPCVTTPNGFGSVRQGGARIDVRQYDRSQAGADYICKCLGANAYELGKYNLALDVTLSDSVIRLIRGIDSSGERRGGLHT